MPFAAQLKVRFGDIDHAGIVYYPRFLHYFHVALEELFAAELGIPYHVVLDEHRWGLPTRHLEIDFQSPLRFGDEIAVAVSVEHLGTTSVVWRYRVERQDGQLAAEGRIVTVGLDMASFEKRAIPDWLRERLVAYQGRQ